MNAKTLLAYLHLFKVGMVEGCRQSLRRFGGGGGNYECFFFSLSYFAAVQSKGMGDKRG